MLSVATSLNSVLKHLEDHCFSTEQGLEPEPRVRSCAASLLCGGHGGQLQRADANYFGAQASPPPQSPKAPKLNPQALSPRRFSTPLGLDALRLDTAIYLERDFLPEIQAARGALGVLRLGFRA